MPIFDVDGSGACEPLTDGLMILNFASGIRGNGLLPLVPEPGAIRTTVEDIEGYLNSIWWQVDVGGDGEVTYADALMVLRHMFGFFGENLTDGCISGGAIRNTAELVEAYLDKMVT